jgi:hypothetical protein
LTANLSTLASTARLAPAGAPFPLLDEVDRAYRLLVRQRAPEDPHEEALVAALPAHAHHDIALATARDDASAGAPGDFARLDVTSELRVATCNPAPPPRVKAYAETHDGSVQDQLCDPQPGTNDDLLVDWLPRGAPFTCWPTSSPVRRDATGQAACRVTFTASDAPSCDPARGWTDPLVDGVRRPVVAGSGERSCEILQATGPALEACRGSPACDGCRSGYCFVDLPNRCGQPPPRFTGGALPLGVGFARLEMACDLDP